MSETALDKWRSAAAAEREAARAPRRADTLEAWQRARDTLQEARRTERCAWEAYTRDLDARAERARR